MVLSVPLADSYLNNCFWGTKLSPQLMMFISKCLIRFSNHTWQNSSLKPWKCGFTWEFYLLHQEYLYHNHDDLIFNLELYWYLEYFLFCFYVRMAILPLRFMHKIAFLLEFGWRNRIMCWKKASKYFFFVKKYIFKISFGDKLQQKNLEKETCTVGLQCIRL